MLAEIKGINEECGIFAIWGHEKAAEMTYYGLHALQHRGQEGAGIVTTDGETLHAHKGLGLINDVFSKGEFSKIPGQAAIGHVLYGAEGGSGFENVQPLVFRSSKKSMAIAHNGNLVNAHALKNQLEAQGSILQTTSDTELLAHLIKRSGHLEMSDAITAALQMIKGSYAFSVLTEDQLFIALDPRGIRPLSIGRLGDAYVIASETCAFDLIGATYEREVQPGELITINDEGLQTQTFSTPMRRKMCAMEYVYFSRPDSDLNGVNVHASRKIMGKELAKEVPVVADVVTGVPDSSISAAIGFSEESGIPYELGLIKNRYVGRTFIQPSQELREQGVKMKLSAVRGLVDGKRVVMVDDSIVRGTTSKRIVRLLKEAGAKEVHVRIASPPMNNPCFYGIDTSNKGELIAANHSVEEIREIIGADSLAFLSNEALEQSIVADRDMEKHGICNACFTGNYPTEIYPDTVLPAYKA